jgi:hypothetical protein
MIQSLPNAQSLSIAILWIKASTYELLEDISDEIGCVQGVQVQTIIAHEGGSMTFDC